MSLSAEERAWLRHSEPTYGHTGDDVSDLSLSCFVAPSRTGKSKLISRIVELASDTTYVNEVDTITTRSRRPGEDPAGYRTADEGITHQWMLDHIRDHALINWTLFETGDLYGTDRQSFTATHNLLPTQEKALRMFGRAAFASMHVIYVVRPVQDWVKHFPAVITDKKQLGRVIEAKASLDFAMNATGIIRVVNYEDPKLFERTAKGLLSIITTTVFDYQSDMLDDYHEREFERHCLDMEQAAQDLIDNARIAA